MNKNEIFNMNLQFFADDEAAESGLEDVITSQQMTKSREVDFVKRFADGVLGGLLEALGVTRLVPMMEGTTLYIYNTDGVLQDGAVAEGEVIPLSRYERTREAVGDIILKKWRKATTAEAIRKSGYAEAVRETDRSLLRDVQKGVRSDFFDFIKGIEEPVEVGGENLQAVLAKSWGQLQVLFEDDAVQTVHFVNPLTVADFLAGAQITMQDAFGMNYVENFLGLGTVVMTCQVPQNVVYSTAKENIILYYLTMNGDIAQAFDLTADETGFIGIKSGRANDARAQVESLVMTGIRFLVECGDGVVKGTVSA